MPMSFWILALVLPNVPDIDVFFSAYYGSMWGHRGFAHSLLFALAVAMFAAAMTFLKYKIKFLPLVGIFFVVTASHALLDAYTRGGFGIPFFWPFTSERYGEWGPVRVSDLGFEWPDPRKSLSLRQEMLWVWLPLLALISMLEVFRFWRRRRAIVKA